MHLQQTLQRLDTSSFGRPPNASIISDENRLPYSLDRKAGRSFWLSDLLILVDEGTEVLESLDKGSSNSSWKGCGYRGGALTGLRNTYLTTAFQYLIEPVLDLLIRPQQDTVISIEDLGEQSNCFRQACQFVLDFPEFGRSSWAA